MMPSEVAAWRDISLGVDLYHATPRYLAFLARCRHHEELFTSEGYLRVLLHRYERFWLPLLAEWQQTDLEPPIDVHWVWHVHMLQPGSYSQYCKEHFGRVLPHRIRLQDHEDRAATERTRQIWKENFPDEPYDVNVNLGKGLALKGGKLSDQVDIALAQWNFIYQVSLPHYRDVDFLTRALDRYKQLLLLKRQNSRATLRLPIDVILMWRVHTLHPIQYLMEVQRILGPYAVDTLGDSPQHLHHVLVQDSNDRWRTVYQEPLFLPGTMFRGNENKGVVKELPKRLYASEMIDSCILTLDNLCVSDLWTKEKNVIIEGRRLGSSSFAYERLFKVKTVAEETFSSSQNKGLASVSFDIKLHRGLQFHFLAKKGSLCFAHEQELATVTYNPHQAFHNQSFITSSKTVDIPKVTYTDPNLKFTMQVKASTPTPHVLSLERDPFTPGLLSKELMTFVECLSGWQDGISLHNEGESFTVARHKLKSKRGVLQFGVQMVRHDEEQLNALLLFHNDEHLVCVAHSIGREQLPSPDQVQEARSRQLVLDVESADQAMLIRNHLGDWAIVIARTDTPFASPGEVTLKVHFLLTNTTAVYTVREDELQLIQCGYVTIDMPSGKLTIDAACDELSEHIGLAFCLGMLLVTCQHSNILSLPLQTPTGSVRSLKSQASSTDLLNGTSDVTSNSTIKSFSRYSAKSHMSRKKMTKRRKMSASFTFLLACGLRIDVTLHGSASASRASSRASSISSRKKGGHVDVTSIVFNQTPSQQQISASVEQMVAGTGDHYTDGTRLYYTGVPDKNEEEKYMDIHL